MQSNNRPKIIGVTGNIGSGKTIFCKNLPEFIQVYFADDIAHDVLQLPDVIDKLVTRWGREVLSDGKSDRQRIGSIVFQDYKELAFLNSVIHPHVLIRMQALVKRTTRKFICFEVPLLFETNLQECFDYIILIQTNKENAIKRIMQRNNILEIEAGNRIDQQIEDTNKEKQADLVIRNDSDIQVLYQAAEEFAKRADKIAYKYIKPFTMAITGY